MYITTRQKRQKMTIAFQKLFIEQDEIEVVESHKLLGVIIDHNLLWGDYLHYLGKRLSQKIYQLSKIKHFLNEHSRKIFFFAHILSLINYASTLWDNASDTNLKIIKRVHKRAIKLVLRKSSSLTINDYKKLNILPLSERLNYNKYLLMHRVVYNAAPPKISRQFVRNLVRHKHQISLPKPRNNLFKSSFVYSGGSIWNTLSPPLKSISNKTTFRLNLKKHMMGKI